MLIYIVTYRLAHEDETEMEEYTVHLRPAQIGLWLEETITNGDTVIIIDVGTHIIWEPSS